MPSQEKNWTRITMVWSSLAFMAVATFWLIWYLVANEIPALRELVMRAANERNGIEAWVVPLPFAVSRAWDVFLAPLFVFAFCQFRRRTEKAKSEDLAFGLVTGLVAGLFAGLLGGLVLGLFAGLLAGLLGGLVLGLAAGLLAGLGFGLGFGVMVSIGLGSVVGWGSVLTIWVLLLAVWLIILTGRRIANGFRSFPTGELKKLLSGQT